MLRKALNRLSSGDKPKVKFKILELITVLFLIVVVGVVVYFTDGTKGVFVHLMYIPIIISVFIFGIRWGMLTVVVGGLVVGPFMPMNVGEGIMQEPYSWIVRMGMFAVIMVVVGLLADYVKSANDLEKMKAYEDIITGYPNANKFKHDLVKIMSENKEKNFSLFLLELENLEMIEQYVDYETGQKAMAELLVMATAFFNTGYIYTISKKKFIVLLPSCEKESAYYLAKEFAQITKKPIYINQLPIVVILKCGIVCYPLHSNKISDIIEKLEKALSQASTSRHDTVVYDAKFDEDSMLYYNTLIALYRSLQNDKFTLVYQPKVRLKNGQVMGVEALLRWNHDVYDEEPIAQMIKIAEDAGFIHEITKWVIKNATLQLKKWHEEGLETKIAINLSSRDLSDETIIEFTKECIRFYEIDPTRLEFELTERTIIEDEEKVTEILTQIKELGITISLDDYGTGHNSLKYLVKLLFHFDYIKIDKLFIDDIENEPSRILIEGIIKAAHGQGIEIVAEGVETEEQRNILKSIGCDVIQGYYYSVPLQPEGFKKYLLNYTP